MSARSQSIDCDRAACAAALLKGAAGAALLVALCATPASAQRDSGTEARKAAATSNATARGAGNPADPRKTQAPAASAQRQRQLQAEQRELQQRLARLKQQTAATEASQSEAADALAEAERAISAANRRLRELATARTQVERQISALQERSRTAAGRQTEQERQLGRVLRAQFALAQTEPWQRLIDDGNPQQTSLELGWLDYVARSLADLIGELRDRRAELAALEAESRDKQAELATIAVDEQVSRAQLIRQQAARKLTLDRLARQLAGQRQSIATLERDDKRLGTLVEEIARVLAEQAQRQAQRQALRKAAPAAASAPRGSPPPLAGEPPNDESLERMRGKLVLPVRGEVTARFGSPRRTEAGVNAPTWKGVFLRAGAGSEVHAVAAGRVVFADWLRGFGNLLIVDHGDGFLSVYGNNEALLANPGDKVAAGEVVAAVGNTGGNAEPGLYFEMRFQGRPVDPLRWAAAR